MKNYSLIFILLFFNCLIMSSGLSKNSEAFVVVERSDCPRDETDWFDDEIGRGQVEGNRLVFAHSPSDLVGSRELAARRLATLKNKFFSGRIRDAREVDEVARLVYGSLSRLKLVYGEGDSDRKLSFVDFVNGGHEPDVEYKLSVDIMKASCLLSSACRLFKGVVRSSPILVPGVSSEKNDLLCFLFENYKDLDIAFLQPPLPDNFCKSCQRLIEDNRATALERVASFGGSTASYLMGSTMGLGNFVLTGAAKLVAESFGY